MQERHLDAKPVGITCKYPPLWIIGDEFLTQRNHQRPLRGFCISSLSWACGPHSVSTQRQPWSLVRQKVIDLEFVIDNELGHQLRLGTRLVQRMHHQHEEHPRNRTYKRKMWVLISQSCTIPCVIHKSRNRLCRQPMSGLRHRRHIGMPAYRICKVGLVIISKRASPVLTLGSSSHPHWVRAYLKQNVSWK